MLTRILLSCLFVVGVTSSQPVLGCEGNTIHLGALNTSEGKVIAETVAQLIAERSGATVKITLFDASDALYLAVEKKEVNMFIERASYALKILGKSGGASQEQTYQVIKDYYQKKMDLLWLEPFESRLSGQDEIYAFASVVLHGQLLTRFPSLPRLINKLANKMEAGDYKGLVELAESGIDPKVVAKEFIKNKELI